MHLRLATFAKAFYFAAQVREQYYYKYLENVWYMYDLRHERSSLRDCLAVSKLLSLWLWDLSTVTNIFCEHFSLPEEKKNQILFHPCWHLPATTSGASQNNCVYVHLCTGHSSLEYRAILAEIFHSSRILMSPISFNCGIWGFSLITSEIPTVHRGNK